MRYKMTHCGMGICREKNHLQRWQQTKFIYKYMYLQHTRQNSSAIPHADWILGRTYPTYHFIMDCPCVLALVILLIEKSEARKNKYLAIIIISQLRLIYILLAYTI